MKILLPTVYPLIAGSTRVLLASQQALAKKHETIVRAPFPQADEHPRFPFPINSLDRLRDKLLTVPLLLRAVQSERRALAGRKFDIFYVHDDLSLYVYGTVARLVGAGVVRHVHMRAGSRWEAMRAPLAQHTIHISEHAKAGSPGPLVRNPLRTLDVQRRPIAGRVVMAGSICENKNQLLGIETLGVLRQRGFDWHLDLYGEIIDADYARRVTARVNELGLADHVRFAGFAAPEVYLETAHAVLIPSVYENQPLGLLEAIAAGVPVVASDIPAHRELNALGCIPLEDLQAPTPDDFATRLLDNATVSPERSARVRSLFSEDRFALELLEVFSEIQARMSATDMLHSR